MRTNIARSTIGILKTRKFDIHKVRIRDDIGDLKRSVRKFLWTYASHCNCARQLLRLQLGNGVTIASITGVIVLIQ